MTVDGLRHAVALADAKARKAVETLLKGEIEAAQDHGTNRHTSRDGTAMSGETNTATTTISRLKRDDPDLAEKVVNGEVSAYAAAREKGWRNPRIAVSTPARVAASLRTYMSPTQLAELARLLTEEI